jgi:hypothetical protein
MDLPPEIPLLAVAAVLVPLEYLHLQITLVAVAALGYVPPLLVKEFFTLVVAVEAEIL